MVNAHKFSSAKISTFTVIPVKVVGDLELMSRDLIFGGHVLYIKKTNSSG